MKKVENLFEHFDFVLLDLATLLACFVLSNIVYLGSLRYYNQYIYSNIISVFLLSFCLTFVLIEPYHGVLKRSNIEELRSVVKFALYNLVFTIILLYVLKISATFSRVVVIMTYGVFSVFSLIIRNLRKKRLLEKSNKKIELLKSLLIVSKKEDILYILENINQESFKQYNIKGICLVDTKSKVVRSIKNCCSFEEIGNYAINNNISEVFFAIPPSKIDEKLITRLLDNGISIQLNTEDIFGVDSDVKEIKNVGVFSTYAISSFSLSSAQTVYLAFKRILDIFISLFGLIAMLIVTLIIIPLNRKNGDKGPVYFKHIRSGKDGKPFNIYKFRTMYEDADVKLEELLKNEEYNKQWNEYHKLDNDPRITKVGAFLRRTSLDELPQFINILIGDMSLIGPRPLVPGELKQHNGLRLYERVKPGITGWWACNGRSNITYKERLELEYYYVKNFSLSLDILILFRTMLCVMKKRGAK